MPDSKPRALPDEISSFLERGGSFLLIRGPAGSGKTALLYQMMERHQAQELILWTNHPPPESRVERNPYLKDRFIIGKETLERSLAIQKIYDHILKLPDDRRVLILLDDVERLVSRYMSSRKELIPLETEVESLIQNIESEFISKRRANLVVTSERLRGGALEHMANGSISLRRTNILGRMGRVLEVDKLEDSNYEQRTCLFTLANGSFRCIGPQEHKWTIEPPASWEPVKPDAPAEGVYYSSGNRSFDGILGGGYRRGTFTLLEASGEVPEWVNLTIIYSAIYNFTSLNSGVILSIAGSQTPANVQKNVSPVIGPEKFSALVRVLTPFTQATRQQFVLSAHSESSRERLNIWKNAISQLRGATSNNPVLDITDFTALEHTFEKNALLQMIDEGVKRVNYEGDFLLGIVRSDSGIAKNVANMSDNHFRIVEVHGAYAIFGVKPRTEMYVLEFGNKYPQFDPVKLA